MTGTEFCPTPQLLVQADDKPDHVTLGSSPIMHSSSDTVTVLFWSWQVQIQYAYASKIVLLLVMFSCI